MTQRAITTAYGRPALDALRSVVSATKAHDPMAPVTILVPNNIAGIVARRHLAHGLEHRGPGIAGITVTTLARLAEQVAAHSLSPRQPATAALDAAAWRSALTEEPGIFAKVADHPATIRALVNAHHELRHLSPTALARASEASMLSRDVVRLHERAAAALGAHWYDGVDLVEAAADLLANDPGRAAKLGAAILFLPQRFTAPETKLARALAQSLDLTVIAALTGEPTADRAVRQSLELLGLHLDVATPTPALATRVMHASDADDEVRCVVRDVVDTLSTTPAHHVAVLYGTAEPYGRLLHEHLGQAGIAVNGPGTHAVNERALARGFLALLSLPGREFPRAATFRALAEAPLRTATGNSAPVARWEQISRLASVTRGSDWTTRLDTYLEEQERIIAAEEAAEDPQRSRIESLDRDAASARELRRFVADLRRRLDDGDRLTSWSELSTWALEMFHTLYGEPAELTRLPLEEQYAGTVIDSALRGLAVLEEVEPMASFPRLIDVLELTLSSALPRVGRFGEGLFVGPVSAAVGMDLDVVYIVGLAEDSFPGRLHEDALLNDAVREASAELPASREHLDAKHRQLLAALASAPTVVASFPRGDLRRSTERLPSRWLLPTLRALTGVPDLAATTWAEAPGGDAIMASPSFASTLSATDQPASEHEWRVRAAAAGAPLDDDVLAGARDLLTARASTEFTRFDGNLAGAGGLPDLAYEDRRVSPTALESYAGCPHAYFVRQLLRVQPHEEPEEVITISPLDIGNFIHGCIDQLITTADADGTLPGFGVPWSAQHRTSLQEIGAAQAEEFAARGVTGHPQLWQQERTRLLADLATVLDQDDEWRAEHAARVLRSELVFGRRGTEPVTIPLPDGGAVQLRGSADKVDELPDGTLVVTDIKTGKKDRFKAIEQDPVAAGTKLQLPAYAHAAREILGGSGVQASYWFVRGKDASERIEVTLDDATEETFARTLQVLVRSIAQGLFPAKPSSSASYGYVDCGYCDPDGMGHAELRDRYGAKRRDPVLAELIGLIDAEGLEEDQQ